MNLNISKYIYVWQRTVIPWTYWKHHLCLQAYRASVAHIKHASVLPHLSPDHYFYLTPRSKSNIHDNFVSVKWQFYSCIRLRWTAPPRSSWVQRCKAPVATHTHTHTTCIRPPLMACANHEVRCLPLCLLNLFGVTGPARHSIGLPPMRSNLPKGGQSSKDWSTLLQLLLALLIWNSSPFVHHMPQSSLHNLWHNEHTIANMRRARRLHGNVDALSTNPSQRVAPHMPNSFGKPTGRPNEDRRRTFHHELRHGCQSKLTCLHTKSWASSICCGAPHQMTQHWLCCISCRKVISLVKHDPQALALWTVTHIFWHSVWHIFWHSFWHILWHSFWHIFWHSFWHIFWHWHSFWHIFWHYSWHIFWPSFWQIFWHNFWHSFWHIFWHSFWHIFWHILWHSVWHIFWRSFWHIFWHYFWHIFWHSFCYIFWHIFRHSLSQIFWHSFWHIFWHSFWHIFWHSFWHIFWHNFLHIFGHSFWHIFWHSFWHIFWHIFWQIYLSDISSDISSDILSDIFLTFFLTYLWTVFLTNLLAFCLTYLLTFFLTYLLAFFLTYLLTFFLTYLFGILSDISFWHSFWHIFWQIIWHIFLTFLLTYLSDISSDISSDILSDISSEILSDISSDISSDIFSDVLSGISFDILSDISSDILSDTFRGWGPARNTDLTGSRLRSGAEHWSHRIAVGTGAEHWSHWSHKIAVEVRRGTLISQDRGWGPARNTDLTRSRLRSGAEHWSHRIAVEVRRGTLISQDRGWGPARHTELTWSQERDDKENEETEEEEEEKRGGGEGTDIKLTTLTWQVGNKHILCLICLHPKIHHLLWSWNKSQDTQRFDCHHWAPISWVDFRKRWMDCLTNFKSLVWILRHRKKVNWWDLGPPWFWDSRGIC